MRPDVPTSIQTSAFSLNPAGLVYLFKLTLQSGVFFRMSPGVQLTWRGELYEAIPCVLTETEIEADGRANRPNFSFVNPGGLFTPFVHSGLIDNAELRRYSVLSSDLDADLEYCIEESFRVAQVLSSTNKVIVTQVRDVADGHTFYLPARAYYPPEFPHVKL